jgi:hypothetical protein
VLFVCPGGRGPADSLREGFFRNRFWTSAVRAPIALDDLAYNVKAAVEEVICARNHGHGQVEWLGKGKHIGQRDRAVAATVNQNTGARNGLGLVVPVAFERPRGQGHQDQLWRSIIPATLQFLITMSACAINERMQRKLDYAQEEVRVLKEVLKAAMGSDRTSFTKDQRGRLAIAGKALSPEERKKCCQIVKPGTILGWFRKLAAQMYDSWKVNVGRPRKRRDIRKLVRLLQTDRIPDCIRVGGSAEWRGS